MPPNIIVCLRVSSVSTRPPADKRCLKTYQLATVANEGGQRMSVRGAPARRRISEKNKLGTGTDASALATTLWLQTPGESPASARQSSAQRGSLRPWLRLPAAPRCQSQESGCPLTSTRTTQLPWSKGIGSEASSKIRMGLGYFWRPQSLLFLQAAPKPRFLRFIRIH